MLNWWDVSRSDHPTLKANVFTVGGRALTEQMFSDGVVAFRKYCEAQEEKRRAMAPWLAQMSRVCVWLYERGRKDEAVRLAYLIASVSEFGMTNKSGHDFIEAMTSEWEAAC